MQYVKITQAKQKSFTKYALAKFLEDNLPLQFV